MPRCGVTTGLGLLLALSLVPVVRGAEQLSLRGLDAEVRRLSAAARGGTLAPSDMTGGTFTVNNYGVFGVDGSAAIINHPQVAMIGVDRRTTELLGASTPIARHRTEQ